MRSEQVGRERRLSHLVEACQEGMVAQVVGQVDIGKIWVVRAVGDTLALHRERHLASVANIVPSQGRRAYS